MQFELFRACALGSRVVGANMRRKFVVALQLKVAHHFIERRAGGTTGGFEPPVTFGATKTPKTLQLNPYQLPAHGRPHRCANEYPLSQGRNALFRYLTVPFATLYC